MKSVLLTSILSLAGSGLMAQTSATVKFKFQDSLKNITESGLETVTLDNSTDIITSTSINGPKGMYLINYAKMTKKILEDYENIRCEVRFDPCPDFPIPTEPVIGGIVEPIRCPHRIRDPRPTTCPERIKLATRLKNELHQWNRSLPNPLRAEFDELTDLSIKLISNINNAKASGSRPPRPVRPKPVHTDLRDSIGSSVGSGGAGAGLNVTVGGAQDFAFFKKSVNSGIVPKKRDFVIEGFLSEFDLSIESNSPCDKTVCVFPSITLDSESEKLFVQIGMNSALTEESFQRRPLNLSIVLDISGSMSATDRTSQSRLDWAKDSINAIVNELKRGDKLSIVTFESSAEILLSSQYVTDKTAILTQVDDIVTKGSTNLEAGLRFGYQETQSSFLESFENRVILISDAGVNTGVTNEGEIEALVEDYARNGVGLTAIGIGTNFKQDLVHSITRSVGGNYIFVNSGEELLANFKHFDFLMSPIATDFKASLHIDQDNAQFVRAYGLNLKDKEESGTIFDIKTLFLSGSDKGGAIILEYDL